MMDLWHVSQAFRHPYLETELAMSEVVAKSVGYLTFYYTRIACWLLVVVAMGSGLRAECLFAFLDVAALSSAFIGYTRPCIGPVQSNAT